MENIKMEVLPFIDNWHHQPPLRVPLWEGVGGQLERLSLAVWPSSVPVLPYV